MTATSLVEMFLADQGTPHRRRYQGSDEDPYLRDLRTPLTHRFLTRWAWQTFGEVATPATIRAAWATLDALAVPDMTEAE
jgi:hypothetical protein